MPEELINNIEKAAEDNLAERTAKYCELIERVVAEVGEHPEYELKRACSLQDLSEKMEFVKDIQSIATSRIQFEKYMVIGADETNRSFCDVKNLDEFDEAPIRQILGRFLDPIPDFEVFRLRTSVGFNFVLFVIPRQKTRRILAKVTVPDPREKSAKMLLRNGDLWTKGTSTAKRLATPEDWDEIYDDHIQIRSEDIARKRADHFIQMAIAGERLRSSTGTLALPGQIDDAMIAPLMEDICIKKDEAKLCALIERLRDDLVEAWNMIGAYENNLGWSQGNPQKLPDVKRKIVGHVMGIFQPAMQRLTLIAMHVIKQSAPSAMLGAIVQELKEVFEVSRKLLLLANLTPPGSSSASVDEHFSHTVPALQSLASMHLLGAYAIKRNRLQYFKTLMGPDVHFLGATNTIPGKKSPLAYWPMSFYWGEPEELRQIGGRINFCVKKAKSNAEYSKLLGGEDEILRNLCAYEFLLEFNSHLAFWSPEAPETKATAEYFTRFLPEINMAFRPDFIAYGLDPLSDLAITFFREIRGKRPVVLHQVLLNEFLANSLAQTNGEEVLAKFLMHLRADQNTYFLQLRRFPLHTNWPAELEDVLKPYSAKRYVVPS